MHTYTYTYVYTYMYEVRAELSMATVASRKLKVSHFEVVYM